MTEKRNKHERVPFDQLPWFRCGDETPHVTSANAARYLGMHPVAFRNLLAHLKVEPDFIIGKSNLWTQATLDSIDSMRQRPGRRPKS